MKTLPHLYKVSVAGSPENSLTTSADHLPAFAVAPPKEFDGPGDVWSPEELLMASIANCLILSFRAIAKASKLQWLSISCESEGKLDKVDRKIQFTTITTAVRLVISSEEDKERAQELLHKAEQSCFVSNSLSCETLLDCEIVINR